jgi:hypothetical protein
MQVKKIRCLSLPEGVPVPHLDTWAEVKEHFGGDELRAVDVLNKYGRQKDSLVNAREFLSTVVDAVSPVVEDGKTYNGFAFPLWDRKTKAPLKKDDEKASPETDADHLNRFCEAVATGTHQVKGFTPTGADDEKKIESVWGLLQKVIDQHGPFPFDLKQATKAGGKPKNPPKYAIAAATNIINGGAARVKDWTAKFTNGYESKGYGFVEPITFKPFDQAAPKGATPEQVEAVRQSNITNLAWAIAAVEDQKRENAKTEYA